jgi:iron complex transport system substrate-binding protein
LVVSLALAGVAQAAPPRRVVSLNPCLDAIVLEVADPGQITALSHYSRLPSQSIIADRARRYPFTWGSAEEVIALKPDLVLVGGMGDVALNALLPRLGEREARFSVPETVEQALVARIQTALAQAEPRPGQRRLSALIYQYHGLASGPHTLVDELMRRTGFDNLAPQYGLKRTGDVPLDALVAHPPQVLLAGRRAPGEPVWADRILSHPALEALSPRMKRETFPEPLMFCGGPNLIPAVQALAQARDNALRGVSR